MEQHPITLNGVRGCKTKLGKLGNRGNEQK